MSKPDPIRVDIISDVVCPWCIVGFLQLTKAAKATATELEVHWHPFELNPQMPAEGQNLREHMMEKYGSTREESDKARAQLSQIGTDLGFSFNFGDESRMVNTFQVHQLLHWADDFGRGHELKMALFAAYFTDGLNLHDPEVLLRVVQTLGMDVDAARLTLENPETAKAVRAKQQFWLQQGIQGVPAMVFKQRHLVTGAQGEENYSNILTKLKELQEEDA